jgi:NAD(P)-dependent dehydrogenase (short-subunit alcohol dehydrogenase family)
MAIQAAISLLEKGPPDWVRANAWPLFWGALAFAFLAVVKLYSSGRSNPIDRPLHGKVVILTGGTSGIGAQVARELANRGAQLVLLTQTPSNDPFLFEYIEDLRTTSNNQLVYSEQVDLSSLHSIRKFATKWIDNAPPRRLDMVVLCASTLTPPGGKRRVTAEGIEETWMVNFLANFHLLGILSPALRAQPVDRDVRVVLVTCSSYIGSPSLKEGFSSDSWSANAAYARSKLALNVFGKAFQKHLDSYKRPDGLPMNSRVVFADPGFSRTPGMRRWLTRGSLFGLATYLAFYFVPWLLLKSPSMGAQSILYACMEGSLGRGEGGRFIKECMEMDFARVEVSDEDIAKKLWEESDALIERVEKAEAKKRGAQKAKDNKSKEKAKEDEQKAEIESLMGAIKKGRDQGKQEDKSPADQSKPKKRGKKSKQ